MQPEETPNKRAKTPEEALAALMRLCARAEKSEEDARQLMRGWGLRTDDAARVLARLVKERFIDDARYAEAFVREKLRLSGWGEYKLRTALQRKGIRRELVDQALAQADAAGMAARLREQLRRRLRTMRGADARELKAKLIRYGASLGYDYASVIEAVGELVEECDSCDEF